MSIVLFANDATGQLAGPISNTATSVTLQTGQGALFPSPGAGQYFVCTFVDAATGLLDEIVWCTARSADTLTIVRAQESTSAISWSAGDFCSNLVTAGTMAQMLQQGQSPSSTVFYGSTDTGTANAIVTTVTPALGSLADGQLFEIQPANSNTISAVTINISAQGAVNGFRFDGTSLLPGDYIASGRTLWAYKSSGPSLLLLNPATWRSQPSQLPGGRLTLTSATPVLSGAVTSATSVVYTPYLGNSIPVWSGTIFVQETFAEISQALSDTTHSPAAAVANSLYDFFVWSNSGVITLSRGPAWSNTTTRALSLSSVNGLLVNASLVTNGPAAGYGVYVGSGMTDSGAATITFNPWPAAASTGPTGGAWIGLWNNYNRVSVTSAAQDSNSSWSYTSSTWRQADNSTNNRITFIAGSAEDGISAAYQVTAVGNAGDEPFIGVGFNSTSSPAIAIGAGANATIAIAAIYSAAPALGKNFLTALEATNGNMTSYGVASGLPGSTVSGQIMQLSAKLKY